LDAFRLIGKFFRIRRTMIITRPFKESYKSYLVIVFFFQHNIISKQKKREKKEKKNVQMTTTRTTTKADNEYMHEFPFVFFFIQQKKSNPQQRLCSMREKVNKRDE
jgi:hypothetical protein